MDKTTLLILVMIGIIIFVLGGGLGILYQAQKDNPFVEKAKLVDYLTSAVIVGISAYGEVVNIEGRDVTLSFNGDTLTIPISENARIVSFASSKEDFGKQDYSDWSEIQKGKWLQVVGGITPEGKFAAHLVTVLISPQK